MDAIEKLVAKRDATYKQPPKKRCETCFHCFIGQYCTIEDDPAFWKSISPAGVCDAWKSDKQRNDSP